MRALPRIGLDSTVEELRQEYRARGGARFISDDPTISVVGTLRMRGILPGSLFVHKIDSEQEARKLGVPLKVYKWELKCVMQSEEPGLREKQHQREEEELKRKHDVRDAANAALHTRQTDAHPCLLAPTTQLMAPRSLDQKRMASCNSCGDKIASWLVDPGWSCEKCDFDICTRCLALSPAARVAWVKERDALQLAKEAARRAEEEERRAKEAKEKTARQAVAANAYIKRAKGPLLQKLKELGIARPFPARITQPKKSNLKRGNGYQIWTEQGYTPDRWHRHDETDREFDSSFSSLKDANTRARYVFYFLNPWGIEVEEMLETGDGDQDDVCETMGGKKSNQIRLSYSPSPASGYWNVDVE